MRALVTGAAGFLGRRVVEQLRKRGIEVRALVRRSESTRGLARESDVDVFVADLCRDDLGGAFEDVDLVVHAAASVSGDEHEQLVSAAVGTERLLDAMVASATRRLVLISSFSVYDWSEVGDVLDEHTPLEAELYERDGYAIAKVWQERLARECAQSRGWDLRVVRPATLWGPGRTSFARLGHPVGRWLFVIGPGTELLLSHVDCCADAVAEVALRDEARSGVFNVVDPERLSAWDYAGELQRRARPDLRRIPVPYALASALARIARVLSRACWGPDARLPGLLVPVRLEARFRPVRVRSRTAELNWKAPLDLAQSLERSFAPEPGAD